MAKRVFTQVFAVAGAILEKDGKILLVREAWNSPDKGKWNHPAGWVEVGESPIGCVIKEVKEETGYDFEPANVLGIYSLARRDLKEAVEEGVPHAVKILFTGKISGSPHAGNGEIGEIKWFSPEEIDEMDRNTLRDADIKDAVRDYFSGQRYPLEIIRHTEVK